MRAKLTTDQISEKHEKHLHKKIGLASSHIDKLSVRLEQLKSDKALRKDIKHVEALIDFHRSHKEHLHSLVKVAVNVNTVEPIEPIVNIPVEMPTYVEIKNVPVATVTDTDPIPVPEDVKYVSPIERAQLLPDPDAIIGRMTDPFRAEVITVKPKKPNWFNLIFGRFTNFVRTSYGKLFS